LGKFKVGIVGCGFIAKKRHIPGFLRLKRNVVVQSVCDLNQSLATSVAREFGIPKSYSDLAEMIQKENLDIVDICTPPQAHAPLAIEAMEKGCHVLLEKPMALKVSDCDQMNNVAQRCGSKLCIIHNEIFRPPFLKARELVANGNIGKLTGMRWCRLTHKDEYMSIENHWVHRLPGGVLGETGPHAVYTSLVFLKNIRNVDICAKKTLEYSWVPYDYFNIVLEGENITSSIVISHSNDCFVADVDLFGTKGVLKVDLQSMLLIRYGVSETKPLRLALSSLNTIAQTLKGVTSNAAKVMLGRQRVLSRARGHDVVIERFVNSVINDQRPPVTGEEGQETVRVMELITKKFHQKYNDPKDKKSY
jgi:UDP-N-acetylglucosamine 3-dehydrogenase